MLFFSSEPNVVYLYIYIDTEAQKSLDYSIHRFLTYNTYTRKSFDLYAIEVRL